MKKVEAESLAAVRERERVCDTLKTIKSLLLSKFYSITLCKRLNKTEKFTDKIIEKDRNISYIAKMLIQVNIAVFLSCFRLE